jgi:hypothetical protein
MEIGPAEVLGGDAILEWVRVSEPIGTDSAKFFRLVVVSP